MYFSVSDPDPSLALAAGSKMSLTPQEVQFMILVNVPIGCLSILGCIFNLLMTKMIETYKTPNGKMVIFLSVMDLISSSIIISLEFNIHSNFICQIQSFLMYFGFIGSLVWTCCFAHCLYKTVRTENIEIRSIYFRKYVIISSLLSLCVGLVSVLIELRGIDPQTKLCVVQTSSQNGSYKLGFIVTNVVPSTIAIIYCTVCYLSVIKGLRKWGYNVHSEVLLYPFLLIVCCLPLTSLQIYIISGGSYANLFVWLLIGTSLYCAQGFANAFAYGFSPRIKQGIKEKFCLKKEQTSLLTDGAYHKNSLKESQESLYRF